MLNIKNPKRCCFWKTGCCSTCSADWAWVSVWRTSGLRAFWVICCLSELTMRYRGRDLRRGDGNMWRIWLGWHRLISNNIYNLQCIVIYWMECAWEFLHFVRMVYLTVTVQFKRCIYTNPQTNNLDPLKNVSVTPATGTWRQLNIFIDMLCSAVHSWLVTAALLYCWRLTRPPLCKICAGVHRIDTTNTKGKQVGSFGRSGCLISAVCCSAMSVA